MSCNHNCNQGRSCDCYHANFDQLGNPIEQTPPWHPADLLVLLLAFLCIVGMVTGVFK